MRGLTVAIMIVFAAAPSAIACTDSSSHVESTESVLTPISVEAFKSEREAVEQELQRCLAARGFRYVPVPVSEFAAAATAASASAQGNADMIRQYGYGVAASMLDSFEQDAADPNAQMYADFTTEEQEAFREAMSGENGCLPAAESKLGVDRSVLLLDETRHLLDEIDDRIAGDERMIRATAGWSTCMHERGYEFLTRDDGPDAAGRALDDFISHDRAGEFPDDDTRRAKLDELVNQERKMASADIECAAPFQDIFDEVTDEYMEDIEQQLTGDA